MVAEITGAPPNDGNTGGVRDGHGAAEVASVSLQRHEDVKKVAREEGNPQEQEWRARVVGGDCIALDTLSVRAEVPS